MDGAGWSWVHGLVIPIQLEGKLNFSLSITNICSLSIKCHDLIKQFLSFEDKKN